MDFWEVLIGTISGFILGFLAEPVKMYFANKNKKDDLRKSLYREMVCNHNRLAELLQTLDSGKIANDAFLPNYKRQVTFDMYNYAKSDKAIIIFYKLNEAIEIDRINRNFMTPLDENISNMRIPNATAAISTFQSIVTAGLLDKVLLEKSGFNKIN
jgi:hypothetical protein